MESPRVIWRQISAETERHMAAANDVTSTEELGQALREIAMHPLRTLVPAWSWNGLRAATFFVTNLRSGRHAAVKAGLVEVGFAIIAAGLLGATSQRLRSVRPVWATALVVWALLPLVMLMAQFEVHQVAQTPNMGMGLALSFCLASVASAFSWYAMRRGSMLGGGESTSVMHDLRTLPTIVVDFVMALPRAIRDGVPKR
jgi:hypothetical protein